MRDLKLCAAQLRKEDELAVEATGRIAALTGLFREMYQYSSK